jgi:hypothetical protein
MALAVLFGAASLAYPFAWDQGINYYVGREWLLRGSIPYRDLFDHKPPGIYVVHAICIRLFGEGMHGIRIAELGCVLGLGWLCAKLLTRGDERLRPGVLGAAVFGASFFHYGFFDFCQTAQCEIWATTLAVAGLVVVVRRRGHAAGLVAGLLGGAALLMKFPIALFLAFVVMALAWRAWREVRGAGHVVVALLWYAAGVLAAPVATLAYFAAHGAAGAMFDVVFRANWHYLGQEPRTLGLAPVLSKLDEVWRDFAPAITLVILACAGAAAISLARGTRAWRAHALAAALLGTTVLMVLLQRKFYFYHWAVAVAPLSLAVGALARDASSLVRQRKWRGPALVTAALLGAYVTSGTTFEGWLRSNQATVAWLTGAIDRDRFASTFRFVYDYRDCERMGQWLRANSAPDDRVLVRGTAAEIYAAAGRHASSRFFWTPWLTLPTREYRREEWLREDREAIERDPPRFVVALARPVAIIDSARWFAPLGYREREYVGGFVVLEYDARTATGPSRGRATVAAP